MIPGDPRVPQSNADSEANRSPHLGVPCAEIRIFRRESIHPWKFGHAFLGSFGSPLGQSWDRPFRDASAVSLSYPIGPSPDDCCHTRYAAGRAPYPAPSSRFETPALCLLCGPPGEASWPSDNCDVFAGEPEDLYRPEARPPRRRSDLAKGLPDPLWQGLSIQCESVPDRA